MKIFTPQQIYAADKQTILNQKISSTALMHRAATEVFDWLTDYLQDSKEKITVFCGIGNNGGDALIVAKLLIQEGYTVQAYVVNVSNVRSEDFSWAYKQLNEVASDQPKLLSEGDAFPILNKNEILIDGIFGIGLNRSISGWVKELIQHINKSETFKLAIDIPSGLFANAVITDKDAVIRANHTLSFQAPKLAFLLPENQIYVPSFEILDIGLDQRYLQETDTTAVLTTSVTAQNLYKQRQQFDHKGTYGHALIIAGSYGKIGAAVLSTKSCLHTGAGLVTSFIPECGYNILQSTTPEAMVLTDVHEKKITDIAVDIHPSAIAVGMGIGQDIETKNALLKLFQTKDSPMILDADAINLIAEHKDLQDAIPKCSIFTPHPGELKRLLGEWESDYDKIEKVKQFSIKHKSVVLIKGAFTTIVSGEKLFINTTGNPGMATGGSGDVLSGILAALVSQGYDIVSASILGVYIHGKAGDFALEENGYESLLASAITDYIGQAFIDLYPSGYGD